jgi:hypothetical protein
MQPEITLGTTSVVTKWTSDVGRIVVENDTSRLIGCYPRDCNPIVPVPGSANLTSAGTMCVSVASYVELIHSFRNATGYDGHEISLRDQILPWAVKESFCDIRAYDLGGEVLDLGIPTNIRHIQNRGL